MLQSYKLTIAIFFLLAPFTVMAQTKDDFSDGNFTTSPQWFGDETKFAINTSLQLQLSTTANTPAYLATPVNLTSINNTEWDFWIKLGFSPSSSNNARVYLSADQQNLTTVLSGYYLQFGEASSSDKIELFRQDGLTVTSICRGKTAISKSFEMRIKVLRDSAANWIIMTDSTGGVNFSPETTGIDSTYNTLKYIGIVCNYTASNATKFYFDDFYVGNEQIDKQAPVIDSIELNLPNKVTVYFNEAVNKNSAQAVSNYSIDNNFGEPLQALVSSSSNNSVMLTFPGEFQDGVSYNLTIRNVKDIAGNLMLPAVIPLYYYTTKPFDVVINEVMPDPTIDCVDFVEVYNRSNKPVELNKLYLCSIDTIKNILIQQKQISHKKILLLPGNYLVLSTNNAAVKQHYYTQNAAAFLDMASIPPMNIEGDIIALADSSHLIDKLIYTSSMHFPLLTNTKGVSLERIDYNRPTADRTNWHSAAEQVGFATPGYKNSQYLQNDLNSEVTITPEIFSPDNDGYNDVVTIGYNFNNTGNVATVNIYDTAGRLVRSLVRNQLLGTSGAFSWDGITDNLEKARSGIYIFYMELFDTKGNTKQFKKTAVLAIK